MKTGIAPVAPDNPPPRPVVTLLPSPRRRGPVLDTLIDVRREMARVFPNSELVELSFDHPIYHQVYDFAGGLPKIHEHEEGVPRGYGIYLGGRMVVFYSFNTNISDGWTAAHKDPPEVREQAYRVGVNIVAYFVSH